MATLIIEGSGTGGAEPRRRFSDDDKARIVSEAMMPEASVSDVALRYRVCASLVYRWRRVLLRHGVAIDVELEQLHVQVARLRRMAFGRSSERLTREADQLEFGLEEAQAEAAAKVHRPSPPRATPPSPIASRSPTTCRAKR